VVRVKALESNGGARESVEREILTNSAKKALQRGERIIGTMSGTLGSPEAIQLFAVAGLDYVIIDSEHSPYDIMTLRRLVMTARLSGIVPLIRVPDCEYHFIARALDTGALGVMVPRVETRAAVERAVAAVKYPPVGERGCGGIDWQNDFIPTTVPDFIARSNEETMIIIQVETKPALERVDELVSVPGVDVALIGPVDFSISLGVAAQFRSEVFMKGVERVIGACQKAGIAAGLHTPDPEMLAYWADRGMRALTCSSDMTLLKNAVMDLGKKLKELKQRKPGA